MSTAPKEGFGLVVKTSEYTGNFEREFCAFATGQVGECEVGDEMVKDEYPVNFEELLMQVPDEHGCYRPVSLDEEGDTNNLIIFFEDKPSQEAIDAVKEATNSFNMARGTMGRMAKFYKDSKIEFLGFELREYSHSSIKTEV